MRKAKKRKTELIHTIRKVWRDTEKGKKIRTQEEWAYIIAITGTLFYLDIFDALKTDRQKEYFVCSYLSTFNNKTHVQLSLIYHISEDTISDYCSMHMEVFEECLSFAKELVNTIDYHEMLPYITNIVDLLVQNRKK